MLPPMVETSLGITHRPRRNRKSAALRHALRETPVGPQNFIYPLFVHDLDDDIPIGSMPGCRRHGQSGLFKEIEEALTVGVRMVVLFPAVDEALKDRVGTESY